MVSEMDPLKVAIGIIRNNEKIFLMRRRVKSSIIGNAWELPGGKIEIGESPKQALLRELLEEINIEAIDPKMVDITLHHYKSENCNITLYSFLVEAWVGKVSTQEGQLGKWVNQDRLHLEKFPKANRSLINRLSWGEI